MVAACASHYAPQTSALIDAVSEFGERDETQGGGGGDKERKRGKQIKKRERAGEASIKQCNQIVFLALSLFFSSPLHLAAPQFLIFSFALSFLMLTHTRAHTHTHTQKTDLLCMASARCQEDIESREVEVRGGVTA